MEREIAAVPAGVGLRRALVEPPSDGVVRIPAPPVRLRLLPSRGLTFRLPAGVLAVSYSRDLAGTTGGRSNTVSSRPRPWDAFIFTMATRLKSYGPGQFWKAEVG